jgi:hypothetical protein
MSSSLLVLDYTSEEMNLTSMQNIAPKSTCFSSAQNILQKQTVGHKQVNKLYKSEVILSIFSDHNGLKLEINNYKTTGKFTNMKLNNNQWTKEEIKRKMKKTSWDR